MYERLRSCCSSIEDIRYDIVILLHQQRTGELDLGYSEDAWYSTAIDILSAPNAVRTNQLHLAFVAAKLAHPAVENK